MSWDSTKVGHSPNDENGKLKATDWNGIVSYVKGLASSLASHLHTGIYEPASAAIQLHISSAHAPADANNYVHPSAHSPAIITQDSSNRFVSDSEKSTWNGKSDAHSHPYEAANANIQSHISSTANPHAVTASQAGAIAVSDIDTDAAMAANSDSKVPSQKAVKSAVGLISVPGGSFARLHSCFNAANVALAINSTQGYDYPVGIDNGGYAYVKSPAIGTETTMDISISKGPNRPIFDLYVNNVLDSSGYDEYNGTSSTALVSITLSIPVVAGWNTINLKVNGKNASSTGYVLGIYGVRLR